jgi:hypothetical protein
VENRAEHVAPHFVLAFDDDALLEAVLLRVLAYLARSYRCSREKLSLAHSLDPSIQAGTIDVLAAAKANPTIKAGGPPVVSRLMPHLATRGPMRCFLVVDQPAMVELLFEPFKMLRTTIVSLYGEARTVRATEASALLRTGGDARKSNVRHRHYSDGPLAASLDALVYVALGLNVGVDWGNGRQAIDIGFRCVNVQGEPPLKPELFDLARTSFQHMMSELTRP